MFSVKLPTTGKREQLLSISFNLVSNGRKWLQSTSPQCILHNAELNSITQIIILDWRIAV